MDADKVQQWAREAGILIPSLLGGERVRAVTLGDLAIFARLARADFAAEVEAAIAKESEGYKERHIVQVVAGMNLAILHVRALAAAEKEPSKDTACTEHPASDYTEIIETDQPAAPTYNLSVAEQRAFGRALRRSTKRIDNLDAVLANARRYQWLRDNGEYDIAQIADDGYTEYRVIFWSASMTLDEAVDAKLSKVNDE